jgi:cytochrome c551/c552
MSNQKTIISSRLLFATTLFAASGAIALDAQFPPESIAYRPSQLSGYSLVQRNCMTCHSAHYVQSQPSSSPRGYWEATVKKMKKPFGAQFPDDDIPAMVDYLVKTYGAERTAAPAFVQAIANKSAGIPSAVGIDAIAPQALIAANNCMACHAIDKKVVGPAFKEIANKYAGKAEAISQVARNIRIGGAGKWGAVPMPSFDQLNDAEVQVLAHYVLSQ